MHIIGINRGILVTLDPLFNDVLLPFHFLFPKAIASVVGGIIGGIRINVPIFDQAAVVTIDRHLLGIIHDILMTHIVHLQSPFAILAVTHESIGIHAIGHISHLSPSFWLHLTQWRINEMPSIRLSSSGTIGASLIIQDCIINAFGG
jgi:hypothetical protein